MLCARYSEFWLRLCRPVRFATNSLPPALKHFPRAHGPARGDTLFVQSLGAHRVAQVDRIVDDLQHGYVRFAADFETADTVLPADDAGGVDRALGDNLLEAQPQR